MRTTILDVARKMIELRKEADDLEAQGEHVVSYTRFCDSEIFKAEVIKRLRRSPFGDYYND